MTERQKVSGLLDAVVAQAEGEAFEFVDTNFGLGLGATQEAQRLVELGRFADAIVTIKVPESPRRGRGQPPKHPMLKNDVLRALLLYALTERLRAVRKISRIAEIRIPLKQHIDMAVVVFPCRGLFDKPKYENKMYESVKRGRELLEIDSHWRGRPIEEILEVPF